MSKVPSLISRLIAFDGLADRNLTMGAIAPWQTEAACLRRYCGRQARLDAATCLPKPRRRQVEANLKELGYGG